MSALLSSFSKSCDEACEHPPQFRGLLKECRSVLLVHVSKPSCQDHMGFELHQRTFGDGEEP